MPTSPPGRCSKCNGSGSVFTFDARPPSSGVPQQLVLGLGTVALWYEDGTVGNLRIGECTVCMGSGMRKRFGDDVSSAKRWALRERFRWPDPSRSEHRGVVVRGTGRLETDIVSGEMGDTVCADEAMGERSTALAGC